MDIQFHKLSAENFEKLSKYYGRRHDNTCDSVMLDNFLWADYYHVHFCERDDRAVLWTMKIMGKMYASLPAERYSVTELPDAKDYLYSAEALKTLSGKALHKKKNNLNAFKKAYDGRYEYRTLCCSDGCEVWKFLDKWREGKGQEVEGHLDYEVEGIHEKLFDVIGPHGWDLCG